MATRRGEDFYVVVNGATKHGDIESFENAAAARRRRRPHEGAGAARAAGAATRPRCSRRIVPGVSELGFMQGGPFHWHRPAAVDQPLGLYRRGRVRDFGAGDRRGRARRCAGRRRAGEADRPRRARFAAARGRAAALRPRPRPRDHAGDGRPQFRDQQAPPRRGRLSPARCGSSPSSRTARRRSASASTSRPPAGPRRRAGARRRRQ